jgi:hypothetical protein
MKVRVKQSHYMAGQALRVPEVWGYHISRRSAHDSGKFVIPSNRPIFTPQVIFLVLIYVDPRAIVRQEGLC